MDVNYWNGFASEYDEYVIDAFTYGRSETVRRMVERFASPEKSAADFGCGPGKALPYLAEKFGVVYGYDFSDKLLEIARRRCEGIQNVRILQADLTQAAERLPAVDFIISLNAVLMPALEKRLDFLRGMASRLKPGGHLLLNVPSVESLLYSYFREIEWYRRDGFSPQAAEDAIEPFCILNPEQTARGVFIRGTEPTKHYLREELLVLAREEMGLEVLEILKMEYDWKTEMEDEQTPEWMGEPYPWDWLLIAQKA
ncbi:MAG: methyltransferase domain-containing protein [Chloroflexi bacterium]|nr:methyltransferase domain-containing protein [Chloroflexota bacterium]